MQLTDDGEKAVFHEKIVKPAPPPGRISLLLRGRFRYGDPPSAAPIPERGGTNPSPVRAFGTSACESPAISHHELFSTCHRDGSLTDGACGRSIF